ncbi:antigen 5 like allergen Cul n 1-like [Uranotaenia lowii]|uniref:antigen 5 like allergen Cul n 1-like n=1 Tax=Uranotaenia lowii TaxID=190385 RepID=UPI00247A6D52|nr:antigen 5 like allergen Cul n 1-like [Uranotaenia lowii]
MKLLYAVTLLAFVQTSLQATDYCAIEHCPKGNHVGCNASTTFGNPTGQLVILKAAEQTLILNLHNTYRNKIALGTEKNGAGILFPKASRMRTMRWDDELAYLAGLNARRCEMQHDQCRNTVNFTYPGQNLATSLTTQQTFMKVLGTATSFNVTAKIVSMINAWYKASLNANPKDLESTSAPKFSTIQFTQIVRDTSNAIGCATSTWKDNGMTYFYLVCNYAVGNLVGEQVYSTGSTASGCTTSNNSFHTGLCSTLEP